MTQLSRGITTTTTTHQQPSSSTPWDDRTQTTVLRRLALATALAHAVPIGVAFGLPGTIDPVARYLHYETAYLAGDLDPAFEVLTVFELKMVTDSDGLDEDLLWLRTTMANYRPDYVAVEYTWRYIEAVHEEVPYQDEQCALYAIGVCNGHYSQIPVAGGVCGWRAFFSRFNRKAWGLPTFGMTQKGHASMSSWSPAGGWSNQLGANWPFGWWGPRSGVDFYIEVQAREQRASFQTVLRGGWVAKARGEVPAGIDWGGLPLNPKAYGLGGVWGALMLYAKKIAAMLPYPPRVVGPSVVPTKVAALLAAWPAVWPKPNVTTDSNGTIIMPGAAFEFVNKSAAVSVIKSFDLQGEQIIVLQGNYLDPAASAFIYVVNVPVAGTRWLTVNISTWHIDIDLLLQVNNATDDKSLLTVPIYYTFGYYNQTVPVEVTLVAGRNELKFMRSSESIAPYAIREFFLYNYRPDIPAPIANYTPPPPAPRPDQFIEVPAETTCAKQGIEDVPAKYCLDACEGLAFKYAPGRPYTNFTGCFVLHTGVCTFNTNTTAAVCPEQPCTVDGSIAQQICDRAGGYQG